MKVRIGFVSNSSSSSFIAVISSAGYDALIGSLSVVERLIVDKHCKKLTLDGTDLYYYHKDSGECVEYDEAFIGEHKKKLLEAYKCEDERYALCEEFQDTIDTLQHKIRKLGKGKVHAYWEDR